MSCPPRRPSRDRSSAGPGLGGQAGPGNSGYPCRSSLSRQQSRSSWEYPLSADNRPPRVSGLVAVPHARLGQQMAGAVRVVLELAPQARHVEPEIVGAALESRPPYVAEQAVGANQLPGRLQQDLQQPPLGGREMHLLPARRPVDRMRGEVDLVLADTERSGARRRVATAQGGPQP